MKSTTWAAALAFGLTLAGSRSLGSSTARAQSTAPTVPTRTSFVNATRMYVPVAPRYAGTPTYYRRGGLAWTTPARRVARRPMDYNYESARRDLKLYKPWLER